MDFNQVVNFVLHDFLKISLAGVITLRTPSTIGYPYSKESVLKVHASKIQIFALGIFRQGYTLLILNKINFILLPKAGSMTLRPGFDSIEIESAWRQRKKYTPTESALTLSFIVSCLTQPIKLVIECDIILIL